jgi:hypothetical protein
MTRRWIACAAVVLLASGCAARHEDKRSEAAPASERNYEAPDEEIRFAPEPAPADEQADDLADAPRSLDEIQRELAANNAKLRELGVALPGAKPTEAPAGGATGTKSSASGAGRSTPSVAPAPAGKPGKSDSKPPKRDKPREKSKDEAKGGLADGDGLRPDAAKATPSTPTLDAAARCQQVCDLAAISCGLGDQICELADRHSDDPDFVSACERANADCEAAKEACDACVE